MLNFVTESNLPPLPVVVLVSGNGSNLQAIIDAIASGQLNARICAVISNRADAYGLQRAQLAGIPDIVIEHKNFAGQEAFDEKLRTSIEKYKPELLILAGFMRILTDNFVSHFTGKMINIHPSLLPKYRGLHTHRRAIEAGDTEHGLSIHYVSPELDGGPLITQVRVPVFSEDTEETLAERVLLQEHRTYPMVIQWIADKRLKLVGDQVLLDGKPISLH
jgi:phosphoribosylglycinamide formyltransferase-1